MREMMTFDSQCSKYWTIAKKIVFWLTARKFVGDIFINKQGLFKPKLSRTFETLNWVQISSLSDKKPKRRIQEKMTSAIVLTVSMTALLNTKSHVYSHFKDLKISPCSQNLKPSDLTLYDIIINLKRKS